MPDITPNSPAAFTDWADQEEHNRQHRTIERELERLGSGESSSLETNTISAVSAIFRNIGLGGAVPGTSSNMAAIKGFYRTAAPIAIAIPAMTALGITTIATAAIFSIAGQAGNDCQVGDPVVIVPTTMPTTNFLMGGAYCSDTNTIQINFTCRNAATVTATFTAHVWFADNT